MGTRGDLNPYLAISRGLIEKGHHVIFATSLQYKNIVEGQGLTFNEIRPNIDYITLAGFIMDSNRGSEYVIKELTDKHINDSYSDLMKIVEDADILISHTACFSAGIVAEKKNIPWISCVLSPNVFWSSFEPLVPHNLTFLRHIFFLGKPANITIKKLAKIASSKWITSIIKLREELNLSTDKNPLFEGLHSPKLVLALYSKSYTSRKPDYPKQTIITGFPILKDKYIGDSQSRFNEYIQKNSNPIVFTLGSSAVYCEDNFFNYAIEVSERLNISSILLTGAWDESLEKRIKNNPRICQFSYLPHSEVFKHVCLVVHHGGMGTIGHVLRSGVPSLVVPFSHDQPDNAYRLKRMGIAEVLEKNMVNQNSLYKKINKIFNNKQYYINSKQIALEIIQEKGTETTVDAIERFMLNGTY